MRLTFDDKGYLTPCEVIKTDIGVLANTFVFNPHRKMLFDNFQAFFTKLMSLDVGSVYCWIDGSFVTRKELPKDIDLVVFIDFDAFNRKESRLLHLQKSFQGQLDVYYVPLFPETHKFYSITLIRRNDFWELYSKTRGNPFTGEISRKGILQIHL